MQSGISQIKGIAFCIWSSPSCSFARHAFKACQLVTIKESLMGNVPECWWDAHLSKSTTAHECFFMDLLQCGRKQNVLEIHTM